MTAFASDREHQNEIRKLFSRLPRDPETLSYRQDILDDLLALPDLTEKFSALLPVIDSLFNYAYRSEEMRSLYEVIWRIGELQNIVDCFEGLRALFDSAGDQIKSQGCLAMGFLSSFVVDKCGLQDSIRRGQITAQYTCAQKASSSSLITREAGEMLRTRSTLVQASLRRHLDI